MTFLLSFCKKNINRFLDRFEKKIKYAILQTEDKRRDHKLEVFTENVPKQSLGK